MSGGPEYGKAREMEARGMLPAPADGMPPPCRECGGAGKVNWKDHNGDVKEKICPRCRGRRVEGADKGYRTK